jgi:2-keto-4-pentenoate hydratase
MSDLTTARPAEALQQMSAALRDARDRRRPIPPLTRQHPDLDVQHAYRVAQLTTAADVAAGATVIGHKIGLTSVAVQQQLGVSEPDYGVLLDTGRLRDGEPVSAGAYIAPRVEPELAFRLAAPLSGPGVTVEDVRAATDAVYGAIELCDSRIADWQITLPDTIADAASGAAFLLGGVGRPLREIDVTAVAVRLLRNGEEVHRGRSDAVLGDPCRAVAWLANAVGALGETLQAGEVVLSGACTPMVSIAPGDRYVARFSDGLGDVALEVAA